MPESFTVIEKKNQNRLKIGLSSNFWTYNSGTLCEVFSNENLLIYKLIHDK